MDTVRGAVVVHNGRRDGIFVPRVMQSIQVMEDGHVLVQILAEMGRAGRTFDVLDPRGRFLGTLEAPVAMPRRSVPAFAGDTVIAVDTDALDVPYVVRAVIRR